MNDQYAKLQLQLKARAEFEANGCVHRNTSKARKLRKQRAARAKAWATRRAKYGQAGHRPGAY